jgi:anaerobic magnesium-protoporphyrin IX monomethyl ester cyclase
MSNKIVFAFHATDYEYNMGVGFLSAFLRQNGLETDLVIFHEIPGKPVDTAEFVVSSILSKKPAIVALSVMTFSWARIKRVITLLRDAGFDGLIVVGGHHAILSPDEVLRHPGVDAVCLGDGELPLLEVARRFDGTNRRLLPPVLGMVYRGADAAALTHGIWMIENLENYPYVDYGLFEAEGAVPLSKKIMGAMSHAGIHSLQLITGRGCPYKCTYCGNSALIDCYGGVKKFLRRYTPASAVENIKELTQRFGPQFLEFVDETFTLDRKWVKEFCRLFKSDVGLPFTIMSRIDIMDDDIASVLAEAGAKLVFFGLESGDEEYRVKYLNRKMSDKTIIEGAKILRKHGMMIVTFNIFGMPFETKENLKKTFDLNSAIEPDAAIPFIYQPIPSTELARIAYENNMVLERPEGRWDFSSLSLDTAELPAAYVAEAVGRFREKFTSQERVSGLYGKLRSFADRGGD